MAIRSWLRVPAEYSQVATNAVSSSLSQCTKCLNVDEDLYFANPAVLVHLAAQPSLKAAYENDYSGLFAWLLSLNLDRRIRWLTFKFWPQLHLNPLM